MLRIIEIDSDNRKICFGDDGDIGIHWSDKCQSEIKENPHIKPAIVDMMLTGLKQFSPSRAELQLAKLKLNLFFHV